MSREYSYKSICAKVRHKWKLFHFLKVQKKRFEPILLNTLPKSGSLYLLTFITKGLLIHATRVSTSFPLSVIDAGRMQNFLRGQYVAQGHIDAMDKNFRIIDSALDKMWLHVRDPRQALISMVHHTDRTYKNLDAVQKAVSIPGYYEIDEWYSLSFEDKVNFLIDGYYMDCVRFISGWLDYEKKFKRTKMLITQHEDLKQSEADLVSRVLNFYEIPCSIFETVQLKRNMSTHYRKGETNEWASVMTVEQKQRVSDALPQSLKDRFKW